MPKFTGQERLEILNIVASLSIKRVADYEIINQIQRQTNQRITRQTLYNVRQRIKKDSYDWYQRLREGNYEYIHEFKERIREIEGLMKKHHEIIDNNPDNPSIQQTSLAELHRLNVTLSNYYDVAPSIIGNSKQNNNFTENNDSISVSQKEIIC